MTRKSKARFGMSRTYKLNPAVKALRNALFASMALAAVAPAAQAACVTVGNTISCTGTLGGLLFGPADVALPYDPTVVLLDADADLDTVGGFGVAVTALGDVLITNDGSIAVNSNGFGLGMYAISYYGDAAVANNGNVSVSLASGNAYALVAFAEFGDVTVSTGADSSTSATSGASGSATGIYAGTFSGDVAVYSAGSINAQAIGNAFGIEVASVYGEVDVDNSAYIIANSITGNGIGIQAYSQTDDVSVYNSGTIVTSSYGSGQAIGINALSQLGDVSVESAGGLIDTYSASGVAIGISAVSSSGDIRIDVGGTIESDSNLGTAIGINARGSSDIYIGGSSNIEALTNTGNATGINAFNTSYAGPVDIDVSGDISATTTRGNATGINAYSFRGDIYVASTGDIEVTSTIGNAVGIKTGRFGYSEVDNSGAISAYTYRGNAIGIQADSFDGITITNSGDLSAETTIGSARGIQALANGFLAEVAVVNSGDIDATSYTNGSGQGIRAKSDRGYTSVENSGEISAASTFSNAIAVLATGQYGVQVYNTGNLSANSDANVYGIYAQSRFGDAYVYNAGDIAANATYSSGSGIYAKGGNSAFIINSGDISASSDYSVSYGAYAYSQFGVAAVFSSGDISVEAFYDATGVFAKSLYNLAYINNSGDVSVSSDYGVAAYGLYASAFQSGAVVLNYGGDVYAANYFNDASAIVAVAQDDVVIYNGGDLNAFSVYGDVVGIVGTSSDGAVSIYNTGNISAGTVYGNGYGIYAYTGAGGDILVASSGAIDVESVYGKAFGIYVASNALYDASVTIKNYGDIRAATSGGNYTSGIAVLDSNQISIVNAGAIELYSANDVYLGAATATGIDANARYDIDINNAGDIALAGKSGDGYYRSGYYPNYIYQAGDFQGTGIRAVSYYGSISVTNSGDISITDLNPVDGMSGSGRSGDWHIGIVADTLLGDSSITNSGDVTIAGGELGYGLVARTDNLTVFYDCPPPYDNGNYFCYNRYGGGDATVINSGDIAITLTAEQGYAGSFGNGIVASTGKYGGNAVVENSGDITINVVEGSAVGIAASSNGKYSNGNTFISNSGDITLTASDFATGIVARSINNTYVYNSGDITVTTVDDRATGIYSLSNYEAAYINNSGDITTLGGIGANGAGSAGNFGATTINSGDISVTSTIFYTMYNSYYGITEYLGGWANGIFASSRFGDVATVINSGDVEVSAMTQGRGVGASTRFGNANIRNSGDVTVSGQYVSAYGIDLVATSYDQARNDILEGSSLVNFGDVTVTSEALAVAIQAVQAFDDLVVYSDGNLSATIVNNEGYGNAFGVSARNVYGDVDVINEGDITVASGGQAVGISASTYGGYFYFYYNGGFGSYFNGDATVFSDGALSVTSDNARATGVFAGSTYGAVSIVTGGSIDVAAYDRAFGVDARSNYGNVDISNYANVDVSSSNYNAAGLRALSEYYDATIINYGDIDVQAAGLAQGILALSYYGNVSVRNEGDVTASSSGGYSQAVALRAGTGYDAELENHGTITAGSGNALAVSITGGNGVISNYGDITGSMLTDAGDDYVYNGEDGRIFMNDDIIDLGDGYNRFVNAGKLYANGRDNFIYMGYVTDSEGSYNGLFTNNGSSIHMDDGAANDALTIIGDFDGNGDVTVDVDGQTAQSDRLYIEGDVIAGTANTVNISLLSLPNAADILAGETIDIVSVSGSSTASNFVLGNVNTADTALFTADYTLSFSGGDYFLGFEASGLSTAGVLLSSAAPAIQSLWYGSLGTMYQRQGAERWFSPDGKETDGSAAVWGRYYANDGAMSPDAKRSNFGDGGSQDFDFSSNGIELGVGYSFSQSWTIGALVGTMEGDYKPEAGGKTDIDGNTLGAYLTYVHGNGFYADLSYRSFDFDGDIYNGTEVIPLDGDASGYSLEMGYGFTTESKLEIEPQLQYSSVDVSIDDIAFGSGDYEQTDGDSSQFRLGVAFRKSYEHDAGQWTPYGALSYVNVSSASNNYVIGGALEGGVDTSGGSALLELGADARYNNWVFNAGVSMQDGGAYDFVFGGQLNVRYSW